MRVFFAILALTQKQKVGLLNSQSLDLRQSCKNVESGHKKITKLLQHKQSPIYSRLNFYNRCSDSFLTSYNANMFL